MRFFLYFCSEFDKNNTTMKKLMLLFALMMATVSLSMQAKTLNGKAFTLKYDATKWEVADMGINNALISDAYMIYNTTTNNYISLVFYEIDKDAKAFFTEQVTERENSYFSDVLFIGSREEVTYKGKTAYKQPRYKKRFTNSVMEGSVLVCNINNGIFVSYSIVPDIKADEFMLILNAVQFKETVTKHSLEDQLRNMSALVKEHKPHLNKDTYMLAFEPDFATKTVTYECKSETLTASEMKDMPSMKSLLVQGLYEDSKVNEVSRGVLENQYTIIYKFYDKNNQHACTIVVTPDDYNALLKKK